MPKEPKSLPPGYVEVSPGVFEKRQQSTGGGYLLEITVAWPHKALHAHATGHWKGKMEPVKKARREAEDAARAAFTGTASFAYVDMTFYMPDFRHRDVLNLVQSAGKPAIDGIVDAGVIPDDNWRHVGVGRVNVYIDRDNPRVEIKLRKG